MGQARQVLAEYRAWQREQEEARKHEAELLRRYTGAKGADENGRQLDQREFKETKAALSWLATCQMGWYRNRGGHYRVDLLEIIGNFSSEGLPTEHGVKMSVREDGQAWFGWRRTVTGWCFAIGETGHPPDQWEYDGPEPPTGFPGEDPCWGDSWGKLNRNW